MSENTLEEWLQGRIPSVPAPFLPRLLEGGKGPPEGVYLSALGMEALSRALEGPGRNRETAFELLAADAFLTYACEAVAQGADVRVGLESLLERLGNRFS